MYQVIVNYNDVRCIVYKFRNYDKARNCFIKFTKKSKPKYLGAPEIKVDFMGVDKKRNCWCLIAYNTVTITGKYCTTYIRYNPKYESRWSWSKNPG